MPSNDTSYTVGTVLLRTCHAYARVPYRWICEYLCDGAVGLEARAVEAAVVEEEHVDLRVGQRDRHVSYAQRRVDYCTARPYLLVHVSSPVPVLVTVHQR